MRHHPVGLNDRADLPSTDYRRDAPRMRTSRPSTRLTVVFDATHDVHLDQPEALYDTIAAFLTARP